MSRIALSDNWKLETGIGLRETLTDNVFLAPSGQRQGDLITEITPVVSIRENSARLKVDATFAPTALIYGENRTSNSVANTLAATGNLEAMEKFFYIDASAYISQNSLSPFGPQSADLGSINSNRVETRYLALSPYVRGVLGHDISYDIRNSNTWTSTDSSSLSNSQTTEWTASLRSPVRQFGWGLDYDRTDLRFTDSNPLITETFRARLYYPTDPELTLSAIGGYEKNNYSLTNPSNPIYGGAVDWKPSNRTTASAQVEHRFFGTGYSASLDHRTRLTALHISASRSPSSYPQQLFAIPAGTTAQLVDAIFKARIPDPVQRQAAVEQFLRQTGLPPTLSTPQSFYTQLYYLSQTAQVSFAIVGVRNTLTFGLFRSENESISSSGVALPAAFQQSNHFIQRGLTVSYDHALSALSNVNVSAVRTYTYTFGNYVIVGSNSTQTVLNLQLTRAFGPKTNGFLGLRHQWYDSVGSPFSSYREAAVLAGVSHRF